MEAIDVLGYLLAIAALLYFLFLWGRIFSSAGYPRWWAWTILIPPWGLYNIGKVFQKAGYSPWCALVMLIPPGQIIVTYALAFEGEKEGPPKQ